LIKRPWVGLNHHPFG